MPAIFRKSKHIRRISCGEYGRYSPHKKNGVSDRDLQAETSSARSRFHQKIKERLDN
jgi:hypothetical protein